MARRHLNAWLTAPEPPRPTAKPGGERTWRIPVTVVEYGRSALVKARTRQEAIETFRQGSWDELTDASDFKVTKVGKCEPLD